MNIFKKFKGHLSTVCRHKYFVFLNCCKAGLYWRGIKHDMSKFHPTEFIESVIWYQGDRSPIDACKEAKGISKAWMHHKSHNTHHYEWWCDNFDIGCTAHQMPFKDALEMMCDFIAAGQAYSFNKGIPFTYDSEWEWWLNKKSKPLKMHPQTVTFCELMFRIMKKESSNDVLKKRRAIEVYRLAEKNPVKTGGENNV